MRIHIIADVGLLRLKSACIIFIIRFTFSPSRAHVFGADDVSRSKMNHGHFGLGTCKNCDSRFSSPRIVVVISLIMRNRRVGRVGVSAFTVGCSSEYVARADHYGRCNMRGK